MVRPCHFPSCIWVQRLLLSCLTLLIYTVFYLLLTVHNASLISSSSACIGSAGLYGLDLHISLGFRVTSKYCEEEVPVVQDGQPPVCTCRAASSIASSQGSPGNNAGETPQLDDYVGRHASPQHMASGGSVIAQGQDHDILSVSEHDGPLLPRQKSGLWGVESNPSRQPSIAARASSPPQRQKSQSNQLSGILRTGSGASSKIRAKSNVDSRVGSRVSERHMRQSPVRAPSRLRDSSTEEAEAHYAPPSMNAHQSSLDSSAEEEEENLQQKPSKQNPWAQISTDEEGRQTLQHRHSPRASHALGQKSKGTTTQPHQHYHTAEEYFSRARVREALSPSRQPAHHRRHPAKARVLDLHDNCPLADQQEDDLCYRPSPSQRPRGSGQDVAQV